ncbi:MAG TPA: thioredoxin domain-containing protein [Candidatus Polarisedimenticolaceae bacterium]|nr:thioredoxin domain-containing protein [Candidatus Polarisedimenticolaceae bacterium]
MFQPKVAACALGAVLAAGIAAAQSSEPPKPISSNAADSPVRTVSGQVVARTDASLPPALGPDPARVVVVVFSDFQCPVCKRSADATQQIAEEFPGDVRVEFWQHALTTHTMAMPAAIASLAAQRQGQFWAYHDLLFRNQNALDQASLERYAEQAGLDVSRFREDCADPALRERVTAESAVAEKLGAVGTPALMINGKLHVGWGSWLSFRGDVERELGEARRVEGDGTPSADVARERAKTLITEPDKLDLYLDRVLAGKPLVASAAAPAPASAPEAAAPESSKKHKKDKKKKSHKSDADTDASAAAATP